MAKGLHWALLWPGWVPAVLAAHGHLPRRGLQQWQLRARQKSSRHQQKRIKITPVRKGTFSCILHSLVLSLILGELEHKKKTMVREEKVPAGP